MERLLLPAIFSYHKLTTVLIFTLYLNSVRNFWASWKHFLKWFLKSLFKEPHLLWIKKAELPSRSKHPSLIYHKLQFLKTITFSQLFTFSLRPSPVLMTGFFLRGGGGNLCKETKFFVLFLFFYFVCLVFGRTSQHVGS